MQKAQKALVKVRGAGLLRFTPVVDQLISENLGWVPYTQLANLTGRPAMSVPLHWTADGLPIGAQLVGRLGSDGLLLRLAAQLEQAQPWCGPSPAAVAAAPSLAAAQASAARVAKATRSEVAGTQ